MTLYELIWRVSRVVIPESDDFYDYILHTSDDNGGFLRTRYCWWDNALPDKTLRSEYKKVLVACSNKIDVNDLRDKDGTKLKIQFHYDYPNATIEDAEWDIQIGYDYIYLVDLELESLVERFFVQKK